MFKHLFASMNELLDEVMSQYPSAGGNKRRELQEKWQALKTMSDQCIEEWLLFEEKMGKFVQKHGASIAPHDPAAAEQETIGRKNDRFVRGQGYYKLHMFHEAIDAFKELVKRQPDFNLARMYLAMSYLQHGEPDESYYHFQLLSRLSENIQIKAIAYNAMGCIQAGKRNMDKALEYFNMAYRNDPASMEPLIEAGLCREWKGGLQFPFQSARMEDGAVQGKG